MLPDDGPASHTDAQLRQTMEHGLAPIAGLTRKYHLVIVPWLIADPYHVVHTELQE